MPTRSSDLERSHELLNRVYEPGRFTRDGDVQGEGATRTRGDPVRKVCVCVNLATRGWELAKISLHRSDSAVVPSPLGARLVSG